MRSFKLKTSLLFLFLLLNSSLTVFAQCPDTSPTGDCDGDGVVNGLDFDDDNDGIFDADEAQFCSGSTINSVLFFEDFGAGPIVSHTLTEYLFNSFPEFEGTYGLLQVADDVMVNDGPLPNGDLEDHTGNLNGRFLFCNGGATTTNAIFTETFQVVAGATIEIDFCIANA